MPPSRRVRTCRDVGAEHQAERRETLVELIERDAGLDDGTARVRHRPTECARQCCEKSTTTASFTDLTRRALCQTRAASIATPSRAEVALPTSTPSSTECGTTTPIGSTSVDARVGRVQHAIVATKAHIGARDAAEPRRDCHASRIERARLACNR
jgi:hypothetical protein